MQHKDLRFRTGFHPGSFRNPLRKTKSRINSQFEFGLSERCRIHLRGKWLDGRIIRNIGAAIANGHSAFHFRGKKSLGQAFPLGISGIW
jgi:hypothetical protein